MPELDAYTVIAEFEASIRRPKPLQSGMVAQLYGANGKDADAILELGRTGYQDALVHVTVSVDGEEGGGFEAYVRRPSPLETGMVAQFFGENGEAADMITALGLSKFADRQAHITVRLIQSPDGRDQAQEKPKGPYREQAMTLWKSSFFRTEAVWKAVGTDEDYQDWCRKQPCCIDAKKYGAHDGSIVPMHVRRVANGAGTAIKPPYSAIPGCWKHHADQTDHGESAVGGKEFYDRQRIRHLQLWAWERITLLMGADSMTEVHPDNLRTWAVERELERYLPREYR